MKPNQAIYEMKGSGISSLAHITVNGNHKYYVTIASLEKLSDNNEIEILSTEVKHLNTQDVVGKAPGANKKRLYNVR